MAALVGFTCPFCGLTSHNPNDARERYCGRCHVFVADVRCKDRGHEVNTDGSCWTCDAATGEACRLAANRLLRGAEAMPHSEPSRLAHREPGGVR